MSGVAASGGRATGPVRVIREPAEFGALRSGDVLVCPYTNPAWTPLFQRAAAVVVDSGGRRLARRDRRARVRHPRGDGDRTGTTVLTDGQRVTVDGDTGRVTAEEPRTSCPPPLCPGRPRRSARTTAPGRVGAGLLSTPPSCRRRSPRSTGTATPTSASSGWPSAPGPARRRYTGAGRARSSWCWPRSTTCCPNRRRRPTPAACAATCWRCSAARPSCSPGRRATPSAGWSATRCATRARGRSFRGYTRGRSVAGDARCVAPRRAAR